MGGLWSFKITGFGLSAKRSIKQIAITGNEMFYKIRSPISLVQ